MKALKKILPCVAAFFLPNIFLFFLYNNNRDMNDISFGHVLVLSAALSLASVVIFLLYRLMTKSDAGSLAVLLLSWLCFWLFEQIYPAGLGIKRRSLFILMLAVIAGAVLLCRRYKDFLSKSAEVPQIFTVIICLLFAYNFVPGLLFEIKTASGRTGADRPGVKSEFTVDKSLPSPDIYWFHMDGMMNFDVVEKYFGEKQEGQKNELEKRGFVINETAALNAGYTDTAVPALTCPSFYDSYLGERLAKVEHMTRIGLERTHELNKLFAEDGVNLAKDIAPNLELFHAFLQKDYNAAMIAKPRTIIVPIDRFYDRLEDKNPLMIKTEAERNNTLGRLSELAELLFTSSALSMVKGPVTSFLRNEELKQNEWLPIPEHKDIVDRLTAGTYKINGEKRHYRMVYDTFSIPSPKLVYAVNEIAHGPYDRLYGAGRLENPVPGSSVAVDKQYYPQHEYALQILLTAIDLVLENNPDAVIVIQGDHGVHTSGGQTYLRKIGYSDAQIIEMNHSVISAVRIPEKYGGIDVELEPLNIARLLVNRYVGENYDMLP